MAATTSTATAYGSCVQFYEKIYQLHGQLKHEEEEQFNLQSELQRLMPQYQDQLSPRSADTENFLRIANGNSNHHSPAGIPLLPKVTGDFGGMDEGLGPESRRIRNELILKKVKELEATAAVFAARSEKLRHLRNEYESMVQRYLAKKPMPRLSTSLLTSSTPNILAVQPIHPPNKVTVATNTEITGPIKPVNEAEEHMRLIAATDLPRPTTLTQDFGYTQFLTTGLVPPAPIGVPPSERVSLDKYDEIIKASNQLLERSKTDEKIDEDKLRHNSYFDMSTTSESEATPQQENGTKKPILPITISFDDTTTMSETVSASIPVKLRAKERKFSVELFSSDVSSKARSVGVHEAVEHQVQPQIENPDVDLDPLSESLATSVGDSVMDSVQNRSEAPVDVVVDKPTFEIVKASDDSYNIARNTPPVDPGPATYFRPVDPFSVVNQFTKIEAEFKEAIIETQQTVVEPKSSTTFMPPSPEKVDVVQEDPQAKIDAQFPPQQAIPEPLQHLKTTEQNMPPAKISTTAGKRMKIKTDYDSDSEFSEPVNLPPKQTQPSKSASAATIDDDFDDFFD